MPRSKISLQQDLIFQEFVYCSCGCGFTRPRFTKWGDEGKFISNHRYKMNEHPMWKGGKRISCDGYWEVRIPFHRLSDVRGYVKEHRIIWEQVNNASLLHWGIVHHINGDKLDNRPENLEASTNRLHLKFIILIE